MRGVAWHATINATAGRRSYSVGGVTPRTDRTGASGTCPRPVSHEDLEVQRRRLTNRHRAKDVEGTSNQCGDSESWSIRRGRS
jgi:hypothetical protein